MLKSKKFNYKSSRTFQGILNKIAQEDKEKDIKVIFQRKLNLEEVLNTNLQKIICLAFLSTQIENKGIDENFQNSTNSKRIPVSIPETSKIRKLCDEYSNLTLQDIDYSEIKSVVKEQRNDIAPILKRISAQKIDFQQESKDTSLKSELHLDQSFEFLPASKRSYDSIIKFIENLTNSKYHIKVPRKKSKTRCTRNTCPYRKSLQKVSTNISLKIKTEFNEKSTKIRCFKNTCPYILNRKDNMYSRKNNVALKPCCCADNKNSTKTRCFRNTCPYYLNETNKRHISGYKYIKTDPVPKPCICKCKKCNIDRINEKFKSAELHAFKTSICKCSFFEDLKEIDKNKNVTIGNKVPKTIYTQKKKRSPFIVQTFNNSKYISIKPNEFKFINERVSVTYNKNIIITIDPKKFARVFSVKSTAEKATDTNGNYCTSYPIRVIRHNNCLLAK